MSEEPQIMAAFMKATEEMDNFERDMAEVLTKHLNLGPLIHTALLGRMIGVVIASSTIELTDGVMTASTNIFHGYNLKMTEDKPLDKKDLN